VPRRPLICQILVELGAESLVKLCSVDVSPGPVWEIVIDAVCSRETGPNKAADARVIRDVLTRLARLTRRKPNDVGPITVAEVNRAFEDAVGRPPTDQSAAFIQRLMVLGRTGAETPDRQFIDGWFLDGLRADDVSRAAQTLDDSICGEDWLNPLRAFGISLLAEELDTATDTRGFWLLLKKAAISANRVLAGDLIAALLGSSEEEIDFGGLRLGEAIIDKLDLSGAKARRLTIHDSVINELNLNKAAPESVVLAACEIEIVDGVSDQGGLPSWIESSCKVGRCRSLTTVDRIKQAPLSHAQRVFVGVVKKTFFQKGAGRKEEALIRGFGKTVEPSTVQKVVNLLLGEGILSRFRGDEGWVYTPNRPHTARMRKILMDLTTSTDPLWQSLRE
jgi:hypothetical protein